jgi:hypothetical protein
MTRIVPISTSHPKLVPCFEDLTKNVANGQLVSPEHFGKCYTPKKLAVFMDNAEYTALRGVILHEACGMDAKMGETATCDAVETVLTLVYTTNPERYYKLREQISHSQLVAMSDRQTLVDYLLGIPWWLQIWQGKSADIDSPAGKALISALNLIDQLKLLAPAEKVAVLGNAAVASLDIETTRTILWNILLDEGAQIQLPAGAVNATYTRFATNQRLVAQLSAEILIQVVFKAIGAKAASEPAATSDLDDRYAEAETPSAYAPMDDLPPMSGPPPVLATSEESPQDETEDVAEASGTPDEARAANDSPDDEGHLPSIIVNDPFPSTEDPENEDSP